MSLPPTFPYAVPDEVPLESPMAGVSHFVLPSRGVGPTSETIQNQLKDLAEPSPTYIEPPLRPAPSLQEKLYDALAAIKIRTATVAMHIDREWRSKLFGQLDSLLNEEDWEEDDLPPDLASFSTFLRLITFLNPPRRPGLGATHDGHLVAAWTTGQDRLTIECLPGDKVRWALSHGPEGNRESAAGVTAVARIAAVLQPYNPTKWFLDAGETGL